MAWPKFSELKKLPALLSAGRLDSDEQLARIVSMERNIGLPVRAGLMLAAAYYLFVSKGTDEPQDIPDVIGEFVRATLLGYLILNLAASVVVFFIGRLGWGWTRWAVFALSLTDGFALASVTLVAGGFDGGLYWIFFALVVRNAVSVPVAVLQILLNLSVCVFYTTMAAADVNWMNPELASGEGAALGEDFLLRLALLAVMSACCYGVQVLYDRNRRAQAESREFHNRQGQLKTAGRVAAEIAHQLKNPLAIINNAAFNLQKTPVGGDAAASPQLEIIREEVERSDRILTQILGYGQLSEGQVERVDVRDAMEQALAQVFPPGMNPGVTVERDFGRDQPRLWIQRSHLDDVLVNLLSNAREAVNGAGRVRVSLRQTRGSRLVIEIADDGPGIPEDLRQRVFEAYFTTKPRGSGLGLAIVKHRVDLYGGSIRVESELGKGTRFILEFPTKTTLAE